MATERAVSNGFFNCALCLRVRLALQVHHEFGRVTLLGSTSDPKRVCLLHGAV